MKKFKKSKNYFQGFPNSGKGLESNNVAGGNIFTRCQEPEEE